MDGGDKNSNDGRGDGEVEGKARTSGYERCVVAGPRCSFISRLSYRFSRSSLLSPRSSFLLHTSRLPPPAPLLASLLTPPAALLFLFPRASRISCITTRRASRLSPRLLPLASLLFPHFSPLFSLSSLLTHSSFPSTRPASFLAPQSSPHVSCLLPLLASCLSASHLAPRTSHLTPRISPRASRFRSGRTRLSRFPHSSLLTPRSLSTPRA